MKDSKGRSVIIFHLKRFWEGQVGSMYIKDLDLYEEIKAGRKTSEWREASDYWYKRLRPMPRVERAWFVCGYPKGNMPRLEADIVGMDLYPEESKQFEIRLANVVEVKD